MPIANITLARFNFKFIYLQAEAMELVNRPTVRFFPGPHVPDPICVGMVAEEANPTYGRAWCRRLYEENAFPNGSVPELPLRLGDRLTYKVENGDIYLLEINRPGNNEPPPQPQNQNPPPQNPLPDLGNHAVAGADLPDEMNSCRNLERIGFENAARWELDTMGKIKHVGDNQGSWDNLVKMFPQALYAFCVDGSVMYVGKTVSTLSTRFSGYRSPGEDTQTNRRCNENIRQSLSAGKAVRILVLPNRIPLMWGVYRINMAAGLEDALIDAIQPDWNA